MLPARQRFHSDDAPALELDLRLVEEAELAPFDGELKGGREFVFAVGKRDHAAFGCSRLPRRSRKSCSRTGFSTGPTMLSPSAEPSRIEDSSTRRSKPLTMITGTVHFSSERKRRSWTP